MDQNSDEQKQRHQDLKTASTWLADAREWAKHATHLNIETEPLPDNEPDAPNKLNVARASIANAFRLTYNTLLVADAKWPTENGSLAQSHRRLNNDTQNEIQIYIGHAGCNDTNRLLKDLDYYQHDYMTPPRQYYPDGATAQIGNHELQISSLAELLVDLVAFAAHKIAAAKTAAPSRKLTPEEAHVKVVKKVQEIVGAPHDGDYIYRGEPEQYDRVTSSLYRRYRPQIETDNIQTLNIGFAQDEILEEVKGYAEESSDFDVLTRLQHYGGKTNLIDFTTDCLVALFFACDGGSDDDGRVVLLQKSKAIEKGHKIEQPRILENRVIAQKSIFVSPTNGYIEPELFESIPITEDLKGPMLDYLRKHHGISANTIYNDLHGYIKYQELHHKAYEAFFGGIKHHLNGKDFHRNEERNNAKNEFDSALRHYNQSLAINPRFALALNHRGAVYITQAEFCHAVTDFKAAIDFRPTYLAPHYNCLWLHLRRKDWNNARSQLITAKSKEVNLPREFRKDHPSLADFEKEIGVNIPLDIAEMLGYTQSPGETSN